LLETIVLMEAIVFEDNENSSDDTSALAKIETAGDEAIVSVQCCDEKISSWRWGCGQNVSER
jgi:hypothetical protein